MDMTGEVIIPAPRSKVWSALNDPEYLKAAIPGCESITREGESTFIAKVVTKIGPVKASFGGKILLSDINPPHGYILTGEGQGGAAGFAKGTAKVQLVEDSADNTIVKYSVTAQVGGKLAQIGSRLIDSAAKKMADDFFSRLAIRLQESEAVPAVDTVSNALAIPETDDRRGKPGNFSPKIWIPILIFISLGILIATQL